MAEDKKVEKNSEPKAKGGAIKRLGLLLLFLVMAYLSLHVYFIWQPVGRDHAFNQAILDAKVAEVRLFPAIQRYDLTHVDGRAEILAGTSPKYSPLPLRLSTAIDRNEPVTFNELEVNVWLRKRLQVEQSGLLSEYVDVTGVWVAFHEGEIELIIERVLPEGMTHVVSLFMKFVPTENGFSIYRHASQVGQVKLPGGFARLVMPSFMHMADELTEELKLYRDDSLPSHKASKIHAIQVEDGIITLDPRLPGAIDSK